MQKRYKQTEIGVIPEDWNVKNLIENSTLKARIGWQGLKTAEYLDTGEYYLITGTDFTDGKIQWETCHYVKKIRYDQDKNIQIRENDILITKDGTIGKVAFIDVLPAPATLNSGVFVVRPKDNSYDPEYLFHIFNSAYFRNFLKQLVAGSTISHLYQKDFVSFQFPLPLNVEEQSAIAKTLSDIDSFIKSIDKLITKKKNIKQGTMQEILTGKKRLSGFKGEWEAKLFGSLIEINKGEQLNKSELTLTGEYPDWNGGIEPSGYTTKWNVVENTITISEGGNSCGFVNYCKEKFWLGGHCYALKITNTNLHKMFLFQLLKFKEKSIMGLRIGSGLPNIQKKNLKEFKLFIPTDPEEQIVIAQVLSDMDAEIEKLEQKRDKVKLLKIGMMQQLLTGRIRLK